MGEGCHLSPHPARPLPQSSSSPAAHRPLVVLVPGGIPRHAAAASRRRTLHPSPAPCPPRPAGASLAAPTTNTAPSNGICYRHLLHFKSFFLFATIFDGIIWGIASGMYCEDLTASVHWPHSVSITEFGAVGDGATLNTKAFQNEILYLSSFADRGRAKLFVPAGSWLSGEF